MDYGKLDLEDGEVIVLKKNSQHLMPRSLSEPLIRQGILEQITSWLHRQCSLYIYDSCKLIVLSWTQGLWDGCETSCVYNRGKQGTKILCSATDILNNLYLLRQLFYISPDELYFCPVAVVLWLIVLVVKLS